jgi:23S rRNA (cytosine1962-C5)-methyltransferase
LINEEPIHPTDKSVTAGMPEPGSSSVAVRISPEAERAVRSGHPWIFTDSITSISRDGCAGDLAVIFDRKNRFLAVGLFDPGSTIPIRVLQANEPAQINRSWFRSTILKALQRREPLLREDMSRRTTGFRLVHGENDGMPGMVIDRYDTSLVVKIYTPAWIPHLADVIDAIAAVHPFERIVLRLGHGIEGDVTASYGLTDGQVLHGPALDEPVLFLENGLAFESDLAHGQKTGFFFDQRDNRALVERQSKNRSILNLFSYTGGFSVYAARGGAHTIVDVDTCAESTTAARRNMHRNKKAFAKSPDYKILEQDAFTALADFASVDRLFDVVIADPPAFARNKSQVNHALEMYARLTRNCLRVLKPGGTLVQASCSSPISDADFFSAISTAAESARKKLHVIERTGHPVDHPITFREGSYLKCLFAKVE